ncbi:hypothetical protein STENM327S_09491 [Streptomyces tendae]
MAVMGLRLAQRANGVSLLHGGVSRGMFAGLWPGFDADEVPITSVTNRDHAPTSVAPEVFRLGARQIGVQRAEDALAVGGSDRWDSVADIPDQDIWDLRRTLRAQLVEEVRERLRASWRQRGAGTAELGWIDDVLDPDVLTIGFARRVPSYKRLSADAARPGPAGRRSCCCTPSGRSRSSSRARRTRRTTAASGWCRRPCGSLTTRGCATASCSCRTTAWRWRRSSTPAATSG